MPTRAPSRLTSPHRVLTRENGQVLQPADFTRRFIELYEEIGLPPVRLHDLRHSAATRAHAAGASLKDIQEMLGHSSITITQTRTPACSPRRGPACAASTHHAQGCWAGRGRSAQRGRGVRDGSC
ncbi:MULTISPECIES: tyrosine-type recombinase/integrase [Streptomyces]|uniref:tyrosine-type recombinase/integrase n=1 Tax=Streptomyces TaxID=1883 RepID=UPI001FD6304E|nr:tyrosine-type recombinase/integrase [Streptomyces kasugaensis]